MHYWFLIKTIIIIIIILAAIDQVRGSRRDHFSHFVRRRWHLDDSSGLCSLPRRRSYGYSRWCLNHTVQKDSRGVLGTSFRFGSTSEILENIQYGGSSAVKTDSQRSCFIARETWSTVLLTKFAFIVSFELFLVLYSKESFYKCHINFSCPAGRYYRKK